VNLNTAATTELFWWASLLLIAMGLFGTVWACTADPSSFVWRYWGRYTVSLERKLRPMFIWTPGRVIGLGQFAALFLLLVVHVVVDVPFWYVAVLMIAAGPAVHIDLLRKKRVEEIERQLDGFLLALANALKSTPSIGAAFQSVAPVLQPPIKQEIELAIKEMKVGSTLDQALLHMAARVGSRQLDSALSSILIGRQVGGNLPKVLETTSATLREMSRLEGVIRTKTAEGKMQLWVIGAMPLVLAVALNFAFPGYTDLLTQSVTGYSISIAIAGCWVGALILARKVLSIDI
jgi:tight adherence protein B